MSNMPRLLLLCFGLLLLNAAALRAEDPANHKPPLLPLQAREVSLNEIEKLLHDRKDVFVLDVRTIEEVNKEGHLPGAKQLDFLRDDFVKALPSMGIDPAKPCILYCEFGGRARRAAQHLAKFGCKEILLPAGGFNAWKKAGKPIEGGSNPRPKD